LGLYARGFWVWDILVSLQPIKSQWLMVGCERFTALSVGWRTLIKSAAKMLDETIDT